MKPFTNLYTALDETNKTSEKVAALVAYFAAAPPEDAAWALYFLGGNRIKRLIGSAKLHAWAMEMADIPEWLFAECHDAVGDIAETIALLLPERVGQERAEQPFHWWVEERLLPLSGADEETQKRLMLESWSNLESRERFVWNKVITGEFRVGVSQLLLNRALSEVSGLTPAVIAHRLMGDWRPSADFFAALIGEEHTSAHSGLPYPFCLAYQLDVAPASLGGAEEWQVEWKWDGIRAQAIRRDGQTFIWSRGEELVTERFPEIAAAVDQLPEGTVIDGEILPWIDNHVLPFAQLQRRIGRKALSKAMLAEVPVILMCYDLLEVEGQDIRGHALEERRGGLETLVASMGQAPLHLSPVVESTDWDELTEKREESRSRNAEGFMLKRRSAAYGVGRQRGDWWKWKIDPYTVDAVLITAQHGSGKRASLYSDYTFGIWDGDVLVPFAKAYSGLTNEEIVQVDRFVRQNTVDRFGPVHKVTPELVFELGFEGIQRSSRHKSGIAVRFPRILRWRHDKGITDADTLATVQALLPQEPSSSA